MKQVICMLLACSSINAFALNRYSITNLRNGLQFQVQGETLPPRQPEWGPPAGVKPQTECDAWELANGESAGFDLVTNPSRMLWRYPDSMQVATTSLDAEIAAEAEKSAKMEQALDRIRDYDEDTATAAQRRQYFKDIQRVLRRLYRRD